MKNIQFIYSKITFLLGLIFITVASCERPVSDEVEFASYATTGEIFTEGPIGLGTSFYFPYTGSKATAWTVDEEVGYKSAASMRFDVPNSTDSEGAYAGGAFIIDGTYRDLSGYDALTFWAKGAVPASIGSIGFGQDFVDNKYQVGLTGGIRLTTNWVKYIIPIPEAAKLFQEKGMFWYSAAPQDNGDGYTFWIDELKFEKLGTVAQPQPAIFNGADLNQKAAVNAIVAVTGLSQTFNLASGKNVKVDLTPHYFDFEATDVDVARVNEAGEIFIAGDGTGIITASIGGVKAAGSLTIETLAEGSIISVFSDLFANVAVDYYNGYWAPYQTTLGQDDINLNGEHIIKYSELNFVGIQFTNPTVDISQMTHFHIDIQVLNDMASSDFLQIKLQDIGPDNTFSTGDDSDHTLLYDNSTLIKDNWVSIDVPLSSLSGLTSRANLAQVVFVSDATITDILVDNIYFYKQ